MAETVEIIIKATDQASDKLSDVGSGMGDLGKIASGALTVGLTVATTALAALGTGLGIALSEAMEAQEGIAQLETVLSSTGGAAGVTKDMALDLADGLSSVTRFSDDAVLAGENLLLTFTNIGADVFPRATETLLDMATAMGTDAKSGAIQLGKALNDPVAGITALTRVGVTFTDEQKKMIESMVAMGDVAGAQTIILDELQKEFGGSAQAAGETFAGQIDIAKNSLANIAETWGTELLPIAQGFAEEAIPTLIDGLQLLTDEHLPAFVELVGRTADGLLKAFDAGMLLITWSDRIDVAFQAQNDNLVATTTSYADYQAGMQAAAAAIGEQIVFTDELTEAQAETQDVLIGLTEEQYNAIQAGQELEAQDLALALAYSTYKVSADEAKSSTVNFKTESGLLKDALTTLAKDGFDPAKAAADLLKQGIDLASESMVEAERVTLVLAIAEKMRQINTEDLTDAEKEQLSKELELLFNQQTEIENMDKLNELMRSGKIDRYDWIEAMADGVVTQEEVNSLLGVQDDLLIDVNKQITTLPAYKKFELEVDVTGDPLPNVGGYGGGAPTGPVTPTADARVADPSTNEPTFTSTTRRGAGLPGKSAGGDKYFVLNIYTNASMENILDDFAMMEQMAGA